MREFGFLQVHIRYLTFSLKPGIPANLSGFLTARVYLFRLLILWKQLTAMYPDRNGLGLINAGLSRC